MPSTDYLLRTSRRAKFRRFRQPRDKRFRAYSPSWLSRLSSDLHNCNTYGQCDRNILMVRIRRKLLKVCVCVLFRKLADTIVPTVIGYAIRFSHLFVYRVASISNGLLVLKKCCQMFMFLFGPRLRHSTAMSNRNNRNRD